MPPLKVLVKSLTNAPLPLPEPLARAGEHPRNAAESAQPVANVVGSLESLRGHAAQLLPVFRWGSCGDPRDRESPPDPDHLEYPPPGRESLIGLESATRALQRHSRGRRRQPVHRRPIRRKTDCWLASIGSTA